VNLFTRICVGAGQEDDQVGEDMVTPKWEYMVILVGYIEEEEMRVLNTYGEEGWELVTVSSAYYDQSTPTRITAYLKRIVTPRTPS